MAKKTQVTEMCPVERFALKLAAEGAVRPSVMTRQLVEGSGVKATTVGWLAYNAIQALVKKGMVKRAGRGRYVLTSKAA